tara:strand:- start:84 stop:566 length:483 start_codon:yes stop_codon:yes gene_type:complete
MYKSRIALLGLMIISIASCQSTTGTTSYIQSSGDESIKITQLEDNKTQIGETIYFGVDESGISSEMISVLNTQVAYLKENQRQSITIEGHTDEQGTREYNLGLGAKRSNSVKAYMVSQGLNEGRIDVVTYGKERPLSLCSEEKCWKENRRAVTVIAGGFN